VAKGMMHTTWVLACSRLRVSGDDQKQRARDERDEQDMVKKKIGEGALSYFFSPDPDRPAHAFTINTTDREPETGYLVSNPWFRYRLW